MEIYNLIDEAKQIDNNKAKVIAWPVRMYECLVPDNIGQSINPLQKLILGLIKDNKNSVNNLLKNFLLTEIGLQENFINNLIEECQDKGFIVIKEGIASLTNKGKETIRYFDSTEDYIPNVDSLKKVYLFQDLVSGMVIPYFSMSQPPTNKTFIDDDKIIEISKSKTNNRVSIQQIKNATLRWKRIYKEIKNEDSFVEREIEIEDEDMFVDQPQQIYQEKDNLLNEEKGFYLEDEKGKEFYLRGFIVFDEKNIEQVKVVSPFGKYFDFWFSKILGFEAKSNQILKEKLEIFILEKKEEFKDIIPFDDPENVEIFKDVPQICNDEKYQNLKKVILEFDANLKAYKREGKVFVSSVLTSIRRVLEVLTKYCVNSVEDIESIYDFYREEKCCFEHYKTDLEYFFVVNNFPEEMRWLSNNKEIYTNLQNQINRKGKNENDTGNTKNHVGILMLYAFRNEGSKVYSFIKDYTSIILDIFWLAGEGNDGTHKIENLKTQEELDKVVNKLNGVIRVCFKELLM